MSKRNRRLQNSGVDMQVVNELATTVLRRQMADWMAGRPVGRDLNKECGYPDSITPEEYRKLYDREGIPARLVDVWADEVWIDTPLIYETEDEDETEWEQQVAALEKKHHVLSAMELADRRSRIGRYGVMLIGINDNKDLSQPVGGFIDRDDPSRDAEATPVATGETEEPAPAASATAPRHKLMFLRCFDESEVKIGEIETDTKNYRYGRPKSYILRLADPSGNSSRDTTVHWHRIVHYAAGCKSSPVFGTPQLERNYNRVLDVRKVLGASPEMFWQGGYGGVSWETQGELQDMNISEETKKYVRAQIRKYQEGIQKHVVTAGLHANPLNPEIADPKSHFEVQMQAMAISEGMPLRVLMGTEEGKLAGGQDAKAWRSRVARCRERYTSPFVIRNTYDRLMGVGVLSWVEEYVVWWPPYENPSDIEKAERATKLMDAVKKYVESGASTLIPEKHFLTLVCGLDDDEAEAILKAAIENINGESEEDSPLAIKAEEDQAREDAQVQAERDAAVELVKQKGGPNGQQPAKPRPALR